MNNHKLFRHMFELPEEDRGDINQLVDILSGAEHDFRNVGVELTYEGFKEYFKRMLGPLPGAASSTRSNYSRLLKILEGDNLDIIEEAAEKKGLL